MLESSADRPAVDRPKDRQSCRSLTAARCWQVSTAARRGCGDAKDLIAAHLSDLGGEDNTVAAERSIIRRASVLTVELERLEAKFALAERRATATSISTSARPGICAGCSRRLAYNAALAI